MIRVPVAIETLTISGIFSSSGGSMRSVIMTTPTTCGNVVSTQWPVRARPASDVTATGRSAAHHGSSGRYACYLGEHHGALLLAVNELLLLVEPDDGVAGTTKVSVGVADVVHAGDLGEGLV